MYFTVVFRVTDFFMFEILELNTCNSYTGIRVFERSRRLTQIVRYPLGRCTKFRGVWRGSNLTAIDARNLAYHRIILRVEEDQMYVAIALLLICHNCALNADDLFLEVESRRVFPNTNLRISI